jgi:hypothetical protein
MQEYLAARKSILWALENISEPDLLYGLKIFFGKTSKVQKNIKGHKAIDILTDILKTDNDILKHCIT